MTDKPATTALRPYSESAPGALTLAHDRWPSLIVAKGPRAEERFLEFFTAQIRNKNTREAYFRAVSRFFAWCQERGLALDTIRPVHVATYIEGFTASLAAPSVKQHLAAIRMLFDWLVTGQIVTFNPASAVRGPKYVVKRGKTPVLTAEEARQLLDSIPTDSLVGFRDRALIATMLYSFARVSAAVGMLVQDYYPQGKRSWLRLHEKGGKFHEVPCHHKAEEYLDAYIEAAGLKEHPKTPVFRSTRGRTNQLTAQGITRVDAFRVVQRRAKAAGLKGRVSNHSFRATGITVYLENGGSLETAAHIAAHESPRTTKLYDRTSDNITLEEIDRIRF
jgi:site-specific recombinase XerD